MRLLKRAASRGFTVVELLIVVVVIGILAALVLVTYNGIHQRDRDKKRKDDIDIIYSKLESYQAQNGIYPTLANINDSPWRSTNMKDLDPKRLQDPKGKAQILVANPVPNAYAYAPSPSKCDNSTNGNCTSYTLTATLEGGGNYVKQSLSQ